MLRLIRRLHHRASSRAIRHPNVRALLNALDTDTATEGIPSSECCTLAAQCVRAGDAALPCLQVLEALPGFTMCQKAFIAIHVASIHGWAGREADAIVAEQRSASMSRTNARLAYIRYLTNEMLSAKRHALCAGLADQFIKMSSPGNAELAEAHYFAGMSRLELAKSANRDQDRMGELRALAHTHLEHSLKHNKLAGKDERVQARACCAAYESEFGSVERAAEHYRAALKEPPFGDPVISVLPRILDRVEGAGLFSDLSAILDDTAPAVFGGPDSEVRRRWLSSAERLFQEAGRTVPAQLAASLRVSAIDDSLVPLGAGSPVEPRHPTKNGIDSVWASVPWPEVPRPVVELCDKVLIAQGDSVETTRWYNEAMSAVALAEHAALKSLTWIQRHTAATNAAHDPERLSLRIAAARQIDELVFSGPISLPKAVAASFADALAAWHLKRPTTVVIAGLENALEAALQIATPERRLECLAVFARIAVLLGQADIGERVLYGAMSSINQQPSKLVRMQLLLHLCDAIKTSRLSSAFPSFLGSAAEHGRSESFNGWALDNGTTAESRREFEHMEHRFKEFLPDRAKRTGWDA